MFLMFFLRSKAVKRRELEQHFENLGIRNSQLPNWVAMWMLEPWSETEISALEDNDMLTKVFFVWNQYSLVIVTLEYLKLYNFYISKYVLRKSLDAHLKQ